MWFKLLFLLFGTSITAGSNHKTNYDENYARLMFYLSASAYATDHLPCLENRKQDFLPHKFELLLNHTEVCDYMGNTCAFFVVVSKPTKQMVVSFQGTLTGWQLLTEAFKLLFNELVPFYDIGTAGAYFKDAYDYLWDDVENILKDEKYKNYNVTFTGHSLGAALASLASVSTILKKHRHSDQINLYTYGQPRVGNPEFAKNHDKLVPESYRVAFKQDIVVHLPFCSQESLDLKFINGQPTLGIITTTPCNPNDTTHQYHHGTEIWYPRNMTEKGGGDYLECLGKPMNEDMNCSDGSYPTSMWPPAYWEYIAEHYHYFGLVGNGGLTEFGKTCLGNGSTVVETDLKKPNAGMTKTSNGLLTQLLTPPQTKPI